MIQESANTTYKYSELLNELLRISNKFSFVIRSNYTISETEKNILSLFRRFLLLETEVKTWPGTILLYGKKARIYYYAFNQETFELLKEVSNDLYEWLHPEKPEDLCFYNNDEPIFASISHERDSFFLSGIAGVKDTKFEEKRQAQ
jgi:hypothetical protein